MKNKKAKVLALSALLAFSGALVSCDEYIVAKKVTQ